MTFEPGAFYHVYNRANQGGELFWSEANYLYFLRKVRKEILPLADILAYCLMPNHYHFLIRVKESSEGSTKLSRKIGTLQSSYTRAIQKERGLRGSLFQQRAKAKLLIDEYQLFVCFHYIHQNPLKAGLVRRLEEWRYSSFLDYGGFRKGTLANQELAWKHISIPDNPEQFIKDSYSVMVDDLIERIFA